MIIQDASRLRTFWAKVFTALLFFPFPDFRRAAREALSHRSAGEVLSAALGYCFGRRKTFKYALGVLACCKDEGDSLLEWVEYYLLQGVEHFWLYNNDGTDRSEELLKPYIDRGLVTWIDWPGRQQQLEMYNDGILRCRKEARWVAIVDLDEFIVPKDGRRLVDILRDFKNISQLLIPWVAYGSSGRKTRGEGLVIERFTKHAKAPANMTKAIVNPRVVLCAWVHHSFVCGKTVDETGRRLHTGEMLREACNIGTCRLLQVNHYLVKSYEEFLAKRRRGDAYFAKNGFDDAFFKACDVNDVDDSELMREYARAIRERLGFPPRV